MYRKGKTMSLAEIQAAIKTAPRVIDESLRLDDGLLQQLARDFTMMRLEDYIPRTVLDGNDGTGRLRSGPTASVPDWEQKSWQKKYAAAYAANGGHHFDVDDAWDDAWDNHRPFDLVRALRVALAKRAHERAVDVIARDGDQAPGGEDPGAGSEADGEGRDDVPRAHGRGKAKQAAPSAPEAARP